MYWVRRKKKGRTVWWVGVKKGSYITLQADQPGCASAVCALAGDSNHLCIHPSIAGGVHTVRGADLDGLGDLRLGGHFCWWVGALGKAVEGVSFVCLFVVWK